MGRRSNELGWGSGESGSFPASRAESRTTSPTGASYRNLGVNRREYACVIGPDRTVWVQGQVPVVAPDEKAAVKRRKRALRAKVTYTCEAASEKSGLPAAHHAGVPKSTFRKWQQKRNFVYWPPTDVAAAVDELMAMDGYRRVNPRDEDLLRSIVDAAELGYRLYKLAAAAHGIAHPS